MATAVVALAAFLALTAVAFGLPPFTTTPKTAAGSGGQAELFGAAAGCHSTFDRFVIRARFATPGYDVRYVSRIVADGSGNPVSLLGTKRIRIIVRNARGHTKPGPTPAQRHHAGVLEPAAGQERPATSKASSPTGSGCAARRASGSSASPPRRGSSSTSRTDPGGRGHSGVERAHVPIEGHEDRDALVRRRGTAGRRVEVRDQARGRGACDFLMPRRAKPGCCPDHMGSRGQTPQKLPTRPRARRVLTCGTCSHPRGWSPGRLSTSRPRRHAGPRWPRRAKRMPSGASA